MNEVRAIFLSDVHLGIRACQADRLLEFLRAYSARELFLIGDIIDFQALSRSIHWTGAHNTVVQKILRRARHGEKVTLIPGNHDQALREYAGATFGDIRIAHEWIHIGADGRRYLLVHGDAHDPVSHCSRLVSAIGDFAYATLLKLNHQLAWWRRRVGASGYWSLSHYVKHRIKRAADYIRDFENAVAGAARARGFDGVICGHIHVAAIKDAHAIRYINCGDWVDSCTAIVEHFDGRMELVRWGLAPATVTASIAHADAPATASSDLRG
jgi:UDP-2,3-diacylglucosamine pyrophosphatase LpxH